MRRSVRQRGFTLVEMMVAVTIGLLIMVGVLSLYLNLRRTNDDMANTNSLIENGRFAVQLLQEDLAHAGFWNGFLPQFDDLSWATDAPTDVPLALPPVCEAFSTWSVNDKMAALGIAVQTYSAVPSGCTGVVTDKVTNSDVLVVRSVDTCVPGIGNCQASTDPSIPTDPKPVYFQVSSCDNEPQEAVKSYVLATNGFDRHKRNCTTFAELRRFITHLYYVRSYAVTPGDGIPTLVRSQLDYAASDGDNALRSAVPLIEGVEAFRVELGIDNVSSSGVNLDHVTAGTAIDWADPNTMRTPRNRGDGAADSFVHCGSTSCTLDQLINVVGAKLFVLVRSRKATPGYTSDKTYALGTTTLGPFTDGYKRHLFSSSATLVNISRRRQTP